MGIKTFLSSGRSCNPKTAMQTNAFELRFQDDLNLVMYKSDKAYWASGSGRIDNIGKECVLAMELNGNLKIGTYWETGTDGNPGAFLAVEDYGVATVYAVDGKKVLWASSVLPPGSTIPADDKSLFSSCKNYELVFQHDKNLVLYQRHYTSGALSHRTALWCTRTNSKVETLKMEESGNLVLYDSSNVEVWSIKTNQSDSYLKVETGYISIYSATHERLWTSLGESWMSRMPADTKIADLSVPGTHDTCASTDAFLGIPLITKDTAKCQSFDLNQQLRMGVRFLDVRLRKINLMDDLPPPPLPWNFILPKPDPIYVLMTYHGSVRQDMTFSQVLDSCKEFLQRSPNETIFMSLKDEGNSIGDMADSAILAAGVDTTATLPDTIGAARGKIVLLRRYSSSLGVELSIPDNKISTSRVSSGGITQNLHIQDVYEPENYGGNKGVGKDIAIDTKKGAVNSMLLDAASSTDTSSFYFNFASAVYFVAFGIPDTVDISRPLNTHLLKYLQERPQAKTGFLIVDWMTIDLAHHILLRNLSLIPSHP